MIFHVLEPLFVFILASYIFFVGITSKFILDSPFNLSFLKDKKKRKIFAFWHNRIFWFCWMFRNTGISIPVSTHRDGKFIAKVARLFGYRIIEGSSSKNPVKVLKNIISDLEKGYTVAVTPDGPKGPLYSFKEGLLYAAFKTKTPVICATWYARYVVRFKSWDRFILPLPFNTFYVKYTDEYNINSNKKIEYFKEIIQSELVKISRETEEYFKKN